MDLTKTKNNVLSCHQQRPVPINIEHSRKILKTNATNLIDNKYIRVEKNSHAKPVRSVPQKDGIVSKQAKTILNSQERAKLTASIPSELARVRILLGKNGPNNPKYPSVTHSKPLKATLEPVCRPQNRTNQKVKTKPVKASGVCVVYSPESANGETRETYEEEDQSDKISISSCGATGSRTTIHSSDYNSDNYELYTIKSEQDDTEKQEHQVSRRNVLTSDLKVENKNETSYKKVKKSLELPIVKNNSADKNAKNNIKQKEKSNKKTDVKAVTESALYRRLAYSAALRNPNDSVAVSGIREKIKRFDGETSAVKTSKITIGMKKFQKNMEHIETDSKNSTKMLTKSKHEQLFAKSEPSKQLEEVRGSGKVKLPGLTKLSKKLPYHEPTSHQTPVKRNSSIPSNGCRLDIAVPELKPIRSSVNTAVIHKVKEQPIEGNTQRKIIFTPGLSTKRDVGSRLDKKPEKREEIKKIDRPRTSEKQTTRYDEKKFTAFIPPGKAERKDIKIRMKEKISEMKQNIVQPKLLDQMLTKANSSKLAGIMASQSIKIPILKKRLADTNKRPMSEKKFVQFTNFFSL